MAADIMAPWSTQNDHRRKKVTYGRLARNKADKSSFGDQDGTLYSTASGNKSPEAADGGKSRILLAPSVFDVPSSEDETTSSRRSNRSNTDENNQYTPQPSIFDIKSSEGEQPSRVSRSATNRPQASNSVASPFGGKKQSRRAKHFFQAEKQENGTPSSSPLPKRLKIGGSIQTKNGAEVVDIYESMSLEPVGQNNLGIFTAGSARSAPKTPPSNDHTNSIMRVRSSSVEVQPTSVLDITNASMSQNRGYTSVTPRVRRRAAQKSSSSPSSGRRKTPSTPPQVKRFSAVTTPRQANAWAKLLNEELAATPVRTMSALSLNQMKNAQGLKPMPSNAHSSRSNSQRRRLIDELEGSQSDRAVTPEESAVDPTSGDQLESDVPNVPQSSVLEIEQSTLEPVALQRSAISNSMKRTYAGERTYRAEESDIVDQLLSQPLDDYGDSVPSAKTGLSLDESDNEENAGAVRSIHELRAAGVSRKFEDEMSILISDLELTGSSSLSTRRSTLISLCREVEKSDFLNRFTGLGHEMKVLRLCAGERDPIFGSLAAVFVHLLLQGPQNMRCSIQIQKSDILGDFIPLFSLERGITTIAKERRSNMSKASQASLAEFQQHVLETQLLKTNTDLGTLTPQLLSLSAFSQTFDLLRKAGLPCTLLSTIALDQLILVLKSTGADCPPGCSTSTAHVLALSILSASTAATACVQDKSLWSESRLRELAELLNRYLEIPQDFSNQRCLHFVLQLYTNLANNNELHSDILGSEIIIRRLVSLIRFGFKQLEENAAETSISDTNETLLLSLGAMINLAEWSDSVRAQFYTSARMLLEPLVNCFLKSRAKVADADTLEASQANVMYGCLAVLLGNLCQNLRVLRSLRKRLPGQSLEPVVSSIQEFIRHNKAVDQSEANASYAAFTTHLQMVLENLKEVEVHDSRSEG